MGMARVGLYIFWGSGVDSPMATTLLVPISLECPLSVQRYSLYAYRGHGILQGVALSRFLVIGAFGL